jgi:hypothetical protein
MFKKIALFLCLILIVPVSASAVDIWFDWTPVIGATGYLMTTSTDLGVTWSTPVDMKLVKPYKFVGAPEDKLVFFKLGVYKGTDIVWNNWAGCWYDNRLKTIFPTGFVIIN